MNATDSLVECFGSFPNLDWCQCNGLLMIGLWISVLKALAFCIEADVWKEVAWRAVLGGQWASSLTKFPGVLLDPMDDVGVNRVRQSLEQFAASAPSSVQENEPQNSGFSVQKLRKGWRRELLKHFRNWRRSKLHLFSLLKRLKGDYCQLFSQREILTQ